MLLCSVFIYSTVAGLKREINLIVTTHSAVTISIAYSSLSLHSVREIMEIFGVRFRLEIWLDSRADWLQ